MASRLGLTRQAAHNLLTGRTIPGLETCLKLGLDPVYLQLGKENGREMSTLDDFLSQRSHDRLQHGAVAEIEQSKTRMIRERGAAMWEELKQTTELRAAGVGPVDGNRLEWNPYPFLKLEHVAATFTLGVLIDGVLRGTRIVFGRIPNAMYIDDENPIGTDVWDLGLSVTGSGLVWDVNGDEVIGASSARLAELIIVRLIQYRDAYQAAFANGWSE
jgi:hypothetical protein